jgi:hypothetical protein
MNMGVTNGLPRRAAAIHADVETLYGSIFRNYFVPKQNQ